MDAGYSVLSHRNWLPQSFLNIHRYYSSSFRNSLTSGTDKSTCDWIDSSCRRSQICLRLPLVPVMDMYLQAVRDEEKYLFPAFDPKDLAPLLTKTRYNESLFIGIGIQWIIFSCNKTTHFPVKVSIKMPFLFFGTKTNPPIFCVFTFRGLKTYRLYTSNKQQRGFALAFKVSFS